MPSLRDFEGRVNRACMDGLGYDLLYKAVGSARYVEKLAFIDHTDAARSIDGGMMIDQDVTLEVLRDDVPAKPTDACRMQLPRIPGKTFKPVNVRSDETGTHWSFELKQVNA